MAFTWCPSRAHQEAPTASTQHAHQPPRWWPASLTHWLPRWGPAKTPIPAWEGYCSHVQQSYGGPSGLHPVPQSSTPGGSRNLQSASTLASQATAKTLFWPRKGTAIMHGGLTGAPDDLHPDSLPVDRADPAAQLPATQVMACTSPLQPSEMQHGRARSVKVIRDQQLGHSTGTLASDSC